MSYTIESIAEYIGARRVGECEATIDWLLTDSRSLSFPEETLFFALTTKRNNGARYIPNCMTGECAILWWRKRTLKEWRAESGNWKVILTF